MLLRVVHETSYRYTPAVENAHHMVVLKPTSRRGQTLLSHTLSIDPAPVQLHESHDSWGNLRTYFSLQAVHDRLTVTANSVVQTTARKTNKSQDSAAWDTVHEQFRYRAKVAYDGASEFLFASPYIPREDDFVTFARDSFPPGRPLLEAAQHLMTHIHDSMTYDGDSTHVNTTAVEALHQRKGVCQDFAHIMVACCRAMGVPARYVSGYLLTRPPPGQPRLVGCDASHAWASVYCPGTHPGEGQWFDFDPTNNRAPGEDYVTLATGRDFLDVSPMRGVIRGGAQHVLDVAVTVEPITQGAAVPRAIG